MAIIESSLENTRTSLPAPKDIYPIRCAQRTKTKTKNPDTGEKTGDPMMELTWRITEGPYAGKETRDYVVTGGKGKSGMGANIFKLIELLGTGIKWRCGNNGCSSKNEYRVAQFTKLKVKNPNTDIDELATVCPDCEQPTNFKWDDDDILNHDCRGAIDVKKGLNDQDQNVIVHYLPLEP